MKKVLHGLTLLLAIGLIAEKGIGQEKKLQAGPMLGYVEMQEANIWLQTKESIGVSIEYWKKGEREKARRQEKKAKKEESYIVQFKLADLEYGTEYEYEVYLEGKEAEIEYPTRLKTQDLWQWRKDPAPFTVALGSCLYINDRRYDRPGEPYGKEPEILKEIAEKEPDLMLWLGDNVYYREPDFYSVSRMDYRYKDARDTPQMQRLLATSINLATWDDHDYGPNNSDRSYRMRTEALEIFRRYWANPSYGNAQTPGIFTKYLYNDVEFFIMDNRYHRAPNHLNDSTKAYFGQEQLQWLKDGLLNSYASFKIIVNGNQMTNHGNDHEAFPLYQKEHDQLMDFLAEHKIEGVLFISGDVHYTQLLKTEREGLYPLYEFTSSPLTAGVFKIADNEEEYENPQHVEGTLVTDYNFGLISVTGKRGERELKLQTYGEEGKKRWEYTITQQELRLPDGGR